jgi:hypothetical protein
MEKKTMEQAFKDWWDQEAKSQLPFTCIDESEFIETLCRIAWFNGGYIQGSAWDG